MNPLAAIILALAIDVPRVEFIGPGPHAATIALPCIEATAVTVTVTYVIPNGGGQTASIAPDPIWRMGDKSVFIPPFLLGGSCCIVKTWLHLAGAWKGDAIEIVLWSSGGEVAIETQLEGVLSLDINCDGVIDVADLLLMLAAWGEPWGMPDLLALLSAWGGDD